MSHRGIFNKTHLFLSSTNVSLVEGIKKLPPGCYHSNSHANRRGVWNFSQCQKREHHHQKREHAQRDSLPIVLIEIRMRPRESHPLVLHPTLDATPSRGHSCKGEWQLLHADVRLAAR